MSPSFLLFLLVVSKSSVLNVNVTVCPQFTMQVFGAKPPFSREIDYAGAGVVPLDSSMLLSSYIGYSYSYSYSYRVTLFNELFLEESCSVIGLSEKMGLQL